MTVPATNQRQAHRTIDSAYQTAKGHAQSDTISIRIYRMSSTNFLWRLSGEPAPSHARLAQTVVKHNGSWPTSI